MKSLGWRKSIVYYGVASHQTLERVDRKFTKEICSPIWIWNYYVEKTTRAWRLIAKDVFQMRGSNVYGALGRENETSLACASRDDTLIVDTKKISISLIWKSLAQSLRTRQRIGEWDSLMDFKVNSNFFREEYLTLFK